MSAPVRPTEPSRNPTSASGEPPACIETTLFELVRAVDEVAETEEEVIATVVSLLTSGQVRLGLGRGPRRPMPDAA